MSRIALLAVGLWLGFWVVLVGFTDFFDAADDWPDVAVFAVFYVIPQFALGIAVGRAWIVLLPAVAVGVTLAVAGISCAQDEGAECLSDGQVAVLAVIAAGLMAAFTAAGLGLRYLIARRRY